MAVIRELLIEELQTLLHAENQLVRALPKMAETANNPKLKEAIDKHLLQTEGQVERLNEVFELLGEDPQEKPCPGIAGLIQSAQQKIENREGRDELAMDLALITAAQKVEHYEIAGYGTVRDLARQIGEFEAARLLGYSLGEEEAADHLLTECAKPMVQAAALEEMENVTA
jgi:Mn-containing catalase